MSDEAPTWRARAAIARSIARCVAYSDAGNGDGVAALSAHRVPRHGASGRQTAPIDRVPRDRVFLEELALVHSKLELPARRRVETRGVGFARGDRHRVEAAT